VREIEEKEARLAHLLSLNVETTDFKVFDIVKKEVDAKKKLIRAPAEANNQYYRDEEEDGAQNYAKQPNFNFGQQEQGIDVFFSGVATSKQMQRLGNVETQINKVSKDIFMNN